MNRITQEEFEKLKQDLNDINSNIDVAMYNKNEAAKQGDSKENSDLQANIDLLASLHLARDQLIDFLSRCTITKINEVESKSYVDYGCTFKIKYLSTGELKQFTIVGAIQIRPSEGRISETSPLARLVIGKEIGHQFKLITPNGEHNCEIIDLKY